MDIAAIVPLDSQERDVRETLTSVSLTPAIPPTVLTASSCPMITNVSASLASQVAGVRAGSVCVSLSLVRMEERVLYLAAFHWDTPVHVSLVIPDSIVKEACPVESCPATMEVAVHLPQGGRVVHAIQVLAGHSVSIAVMKAAPPSPAVIAVCVLKRPASRTFTASVPVAIQVKGVSRPAESWSLRHPHALWQTVLAKPMMVFATGNVTYSHVTGMAVTVL